MNKGPFRYDQVGSLLRSAAWKQARTAYAEGSLSFAAYKDIEREEIRKLVEKQKELGLKAVSDGEYNREYWHYDFIAALGGIETYIAQTKGKFQGTMNRLKSYYVKDTLTFPADHPFLEDFRYLNSLCRDEVLAKATIPGPNMIYYSGVMNNPEYKENTAYTSFDTLKQDLIQVYRDAIQAFYAAGCRYLQFDDTSWGALFSETQRAALKEKGIDPRRLAKDFAEITVECLKNRPEDMTLTTHCCRGNFKSSWLYEGDYSFVEEDIFQAPFDGFFLEYDSERAGSFAPIAHLKSGHLVLGLITSKHGKLEDEEAVKARIQEASAYLPLDRLCLSPQCGFSSTDDGNTLSEEEQYAKLAYVKQIAEEVWEDA